MFTLFLPNTHMDKNKCKAIVKSLVLYSIVLTSFTFVLSANYAVLAAIFSWPLTIPQCITIGVINVWLLISSLLFVAYVLDIKSGSFTPSLKTPLVITEVFSTVYCIIVSAIMYCC